MPPVVRTEMNNQSNQLYSLGWSAPVYSDPDERKIAWMNRSVSAGQTYLQSQTAYKDVDTAVAVIANTIRENMPSKKLSRIQFNRLKRQVKEIISTLTNLNPRWDYETQNEDLDDQAQILNKRRDYWWSTSFVDRVIKEALQWGILGAGYIQLIWGKTPFGNGEPDVIPRAFGIADVIPDQIRRNGDIQSAYAVHIRDTMPLATAMAAFPDAAMAGKIVPDRIVNSAAPAGSGPTRLMSSWVAPIFKYLGIGGSIDTTMTDNNNPFPEVDVFYTYIADQTVNTTGMEINSDDITKCYSPTKTKGTMWEYRIPSIGDPIADGTFQTSLSPSQFDASGQMISSGGQQSIPNTRPALRDDCLLYPLRRLVIWTNHCVIYDGPSPWWHGQVPLVKFTFDKWPWQYLGYNVIGENFSIQTAQNSMARGVVDSMELRLDPPLAFDENEYSRQAMETMNTRVPGERIPKSGLTANPISPILGNANIYDIPGAYPEVRKMFNDELDYLMGVQDFSALAKLNQAPSAETVDRLLQAAGPLVADFARDMERSLTDIGYMFMWLVLEFDNTARRLKILGRDGVTKDDFDFQPGSLIPNDVPGVAPDAPLMRKGIVHGRRFAFNITPHSSFNVTDIQNKLFYLQLWRDPKNFPIDPWSLAKAWNLPNFGEPPAEATNMIERWQYWMQMQTQFQTALQIQAQGMMAQAQQAMLAQMGPAAQIQAGMAGLAQQHQQQQGGGPAGNGNAHGAPPVNGHRPEGHPPSGDKAPSIENKFDLEGRGPRSTVSES